MNSSYLERPLRENLACDLHISKAVKFMLCDIPVKPAQASAREKHSWHVNPIYRRGEASHPPSTCVEVSDRQEVPSNQTLASRSLSAGSCTRFP